MGKREKKRDDFIDILRGLGIIAVVLGHVCISEFYYSELSDGMIKNSLLKEDFLYSVLKH